ncbi:hypothetical protein ABPG72_021966 [Tetrahymena utriculariae]
MNIFKLIPKVEYLVSQDFTDPSQDSAVGWSLNKTIATCSQSDFVDWAGNRNLNGIFQEQAQQKMYSSLPPHWSLSLRFDLLLYGDVDQTKGDQIQIFIDGILQDTYTKNNKRDGFVMCYKVVYFFQCNDELILYHKNITHNSSSVNIQLLPKSPSDKLNKGFGFKNYYLYVDTCDFSCATCNGPTSNQCLSCPSQSVKNGNSCTCASGYIQHLYSCISSCPEGFVKSNTINQCVTDFSINCSNYNSSTQLCLACKANYYLYQGQCVSSCPQTSSLSSNVCVDFSTGLINGQYLLNGLFNNYFGQSEITGLGLIVNNFKGFMSSFRQSGALTTNCGPNHLLGGFWLSGQDSSVSRSWTGLAPHWSIRIGFTVWKIDQWSNQNFFVSVDGQNKTAIQFSENSGSDNICGYGSFNDQNKKQFVNITHTSTTLNLKFFTDLNQDLMTESFALSNLYVLVDFCSSNCLTCNAQGCLTCQASYFLYISACVQNCPSNTYQSSSTTCLDCNSNCKTCSSSGKPNNCQSCSGTLFLSTSGNTCTSNCLINEFKNTSNNKCIPCHSSCSTCSGSSNNNCLSCSGSSYFNSVIKTCEPSCPDGTYPNSTGNICSQCDSSCATCNGGTSSNCLSCTYPTRYFQPYSSQCVTKCNSKYKTNCLSCSGSNFFDSAANSCVVSCPKGTYKNQSKNICSPCDDNCTTCNGPNTNQCLTCALPKYYQPSTGQCVQQCNLNQYQDDLSVSCLNCHQSCASCFGGDQNNCLSCQGSLYLATSGNICLTSCISSDKTNCLSCSGSNFFDSATNSCVVSCPKGTYKNQSKNICSPCDDNCTTCNGPNTNQCLTCALPKYYQPSTGQCVQQCNLNQYQDDLSVSCLNCHQSCASCFGGDQNNCVSCQGSLYLATSGNICLTSCISSDDSQCLTCILPKYYQSLTGQCLNNCNTNQYQDDSSATCLNCNSNCESCFGGALNNCLSCSGSLFLDLSTNSCVQNCPVTYYQNPANNQCSKCNNSCTSCNGGLINNCLSCNPPLYFEPATNTCVSSCQKGQYMDSKTDTCLKCDSTCSTCTKGGANGCSSCVLPLYYQQSSSSCVESCQTNQYQNNLTATCSSCDNSCASCSGHGKNECLSCSGSLYFDSTGKKCVNKCPDSYFADLSTNTCKQCDQSCKTCSGNLSTNCLSCSLPFYYNSITQKCDLDCDQNQYKDIKIAQCLGCDSSCQTCSGGQNTQCLSCTSNLYLDQNMCKSSCPDGYYKNIQNNTCSKCDPSCLTCFGGTSTNCFQCSQPRFFQKITNSCEKACNKNQYSDISDSTCKYCDSSCLSCSGPSTNQCISCQGQTFLYQNQCISKCPDGYYQDISNNKCSQCNSSCKTCNSAYSCSSCKSPLIFYKNDCLQICPSGFYSSSSSSKCESCYSTCKSCNGPSAKECLSCPQGYFLQEFSCVQQCGDGYYLDQYKCSQCHPQCKTCTGSSQDQCIECNDLMFKYNSHCLSKCPQETYQLSDSQKQCFQCSSSCFSDCNGPSEQDCTILKPQNQIIVYILLAKTLLWVISSIIGTIQDHKNKKTQILTVVPSNLIEKQLELKDNNSPIKRNQRNITSDLQTQNIAVKDSLVNKFKSYDVVLDKDLLPSFNQNERFQADNFQMQQSVNNHGNTKSEVNLQDQIEKCTNQNNRRIPRKTQFILRANKNKQSQFSMNALSSQANIIDSSPINSKRQLQDQIATASNLSSQIQPSNFGQEEIQKYQLNQKLKYSILGNEWVELFAFYDPNIKRVSRITLIYLKYHMFFFICEYYKFSPKYYISLCLTAGLCMKLIIEKLLFLITKYTRFGNLLSIVVFFGGLGACFFCWFLPKIQQANQSVDHSWSFQYLITFSFDFLIFQQLLGLLKYCITVKFLNMQNPNSITKGLKNEHFIKNIKK